MQQELFELFEHSYQSPRDVIEKFKAIVTDQPLDFFGKKSNVAHITGSVVVVDETGQNTLLTNHKKLKKWLQLGGHWCDFEDSPTESLKDSSIRELKEEGYGNQDIPYKILNNEQILDLDIHDVGGHLHYDVCFLVEVSKSIPIVVSDESEDVQWKNISDIYQNKEAYDPRLVRMLTKAQEVFKFEKNTTPKLKQKI